MNAKGTHSFKQYQIANWHKVREFAIYLGFKIRVTGGNDYTHQIDCTREDFIALITLSYEG